MAEVADHPGRGGVQAKGRNNATITAQARGALATLRNVRLCAQFGLRSDITPPPAFVLISGKYIVSRYGTTDALECKLTYWVDGYGILDRHQDARANQDLTGLGFVAKAGF